MKKGLFFLPGCIAAMLWFLTASASAGQVITNDDRSWAKEAVEREKTLDISQCPPNTVAVLYFVNKTGRTSLDPLRKGMTIMLITDLSKVDRIAIVERTRFQALLEELGLAESGLVQRETAPEVGRILCAKTVVGGDILTGELVELKLNSDLLDVPAENIFGSADSEGALKELFKL